MYLALKTLSNHVEPMKGWVQESRSIHPASPDRRWRSAGSFSRTA